MAQHQSGFSPHDQGFYSFLTVYTAGSVMMSVPNMPSAFSVSLCMRKESPDSYSSSLYSWASSCWPHGVPRAAEGGAKRMEVVMDQRQKKHGVVIGALIVPGSWQCRRGNGIVEVSG